MKKILNLLGLSTKQEVEEYRNLCIELGRILQKASEDFLHIPSAISDLHDVTDGPIQSVHIDLESICANFYGDYSPGANGMDYHSPQELTEWINSTMRT